MGFVELLDKIKIDHFNFARELNWNSFCQAIKNKHYNVAVKLLQYGRNLIYKLGYFGPEELYILIANYDCPRINFDHNILDDISIILNKDTNDLSSDELDFFSRTKKMWDEYSNNKLWKPETNHLFSNNKKKIILTFMCIITKLRKILKHTIPKPIIHILINLFIFT